MQQLPYSRHLESTIPEETGTHLIPLLLFKINRRLPMLHAATVHEYIQLAPIQLADLRYYTSHLVTLRQIAFVAVAAAAEGVYGVFDVCCCGRVSLEEDYVGTGLGSGEGG